MRRSSVWRILEEAALTPQRSVYWLHRHDPDCNAKAPDICQRSVHALRFSPHGRLVSCADEQTGRQIFQRAPPTPAGQPGTPEKREHEDIRHGARALRASVVVPTGPMVWHLGQTRTRGDGAAHLAHVVQQLPTLQRYDGVVDHLHTHWSREVCRLVAHWCHVPYCPKALQRGVQRRAFLSDPTPAPVCHFTPKQGSWLHHVALWFRVCARRLLTRGDFASAHDCATRLGDCMESDNTPHAPPYRWPSTGHPLVRATPLSQTRRQRCQGRAWFRPRPQRFARALSPPRPYKRSAGLLVVHL